MRRITPFAAFLAAVIGITALGATALAARGGPVGPLTAYASQTLGYSVQLPGAWRRSAVLSALVNNGNLKVGHEVSDPTKAMVEIATDARRFGVRIIEVEPNFGRGMWVAAFQPILTKIWAKGGATVQESEWAKGQKETRIIDTLEPVLAQHRLVVAESFLREDVATEDRNYSLPPPAHPHHQRPRCAHSR